MGVGVSLTLLTVPSTLFLLLDRLSQTRDEGLCLVLFTLLCYILYLFDITGRLISCKGK